MERSAGILLPIFSLPSAYGIGSLGREAREFANFLHRAGQRWWQIQPVGPTGAGDSPYIQCVLPLQATPFSSTLDTLAQRGLLTEQELASARVPQGGRIDYAALYEGREALLRKAFERIDPAEAEAARLFREHDALAAGVRALPGHQRPRFGGAAWYDWPDEALRRHEPAALERQKAELAEDIAFHTWVQYCFFTQWESLKTYVNGLGIRIIGDLPIYVSLDSADVWSERKEFLLDGRGMPGKVAGVPPDYFCADGQLWGNPLYDWKAMKQDGFGWWIRRVEGAARLFDAIRLDHFRAFASYWAVPAGAKTAREGAWEQGPGMDLLGVLTSWFPQITYIAEDLGILTEDVHRLRKDSGLPGMKVLEFAFSGPDNAYLPHQYPDSRCICYTGTHDNDTAAGWYAIRHALRRKPTPASIWAWSGTTPRRCAGRCCGAGQGSHRGSCLWPKMQDYLGLGSEPG